MKPLEEMGERVNRALDETPGEVFDLSRARSNFLSDSQQASRGSAYFARAGAVLGLVLAAWVSFLWFPKSSLEVGVNGVSLSEGAALVGDRSGGLPITFSDGSSVLLEKGASARLLALTSQGAHLEITDGSAEVSVVHREDTSFSFDVGPYLVAVTGTRFTVGWDRDSAVFSLSMHDGSVRVTGPRSEDGRVVVAGQNLRLDAEGRPWEMKDEAPNGVKSGRVQELLDNDGEPVVVFEEGATSSVNAPIPAKKDGKATRPDVDVAEKAKSWIELAREGENVLAVAAAERIGLSEILGRASDRELLRLAYSALYCGRGALATRVFKKVRFRFPKAPTAAEAAFGIGRLSPGASGVRWFEIYLDELPSGPLAREAMGRVLEARAGTPNAKSLSLAKQYLARFPRGPRADLASRMLKSVK